eukprot:tig00000498_g1627.t1
MAFARLEQRFSALDQKERDVREFYRKGSAGRKHRYIGYTDEADEQWLEANRALVEDPVTWADVRAKLAAPHRGEAAAAALAAEGRRRPSRVQSAPVYSKANSIMRRYRRLLAAQEELEPAALVSEPLAQQVEDLRGAAYETVDAAFAARAERVRTALASPRNTEGDLPPVLKPDLRARPDPSPPATLTFSERAGTGGAQAAGRSFSGSEAEGGPEEAAGGPLDGPEGPPPRPPPPPRPASSASSSRSKGPGPGAVEAGAHVVESVAEAEEGQPGRPEFYHLNVAIQHHSALASWRFDCYVTDITLDERPVHVYRNLRVDSANFLLFGPRGPVLAPCEDFPWVREPRDLHGHGLRIEVFSTHPVRSRVVDSCVYFGRSAQERALLQSRAVAEALAAAAAASAPVVPPRPSSSASAHRLHHEPSHELLPPPPAPLPSSSGPSAAVPRTRSAESLRRSGSAGSALARGASGAGPPTQDPALMVTSLRRQASRGPPAPGELNASVDSEAGSRRGADVREALERMRAKMAEELRQRKESLQADVAVGQRELEEIVRLPKPRSAPPRPSARARPAPRPAPRTLRSTPRPPPAPSAPAQPQPPPQAQAQAQAQGRLGRLLPRRWGWRGGAAGVGGVGGGAVGDRGVERPLGAALLPGLLPPLRRPRQALPTHQARPRPQARPGPRPPPAPHPRTAKVPMRPEPLGAPAPPHPHSHAHEAAAPSSAPAPAPAPGPAVSPRTGARMYAVVPAARPVGGPLAGVRLSGAGEPARAPEPPPAAAPGPAGDSEPEFEGSEPEAGAPPHGEQPAEKRPGVLVPSALV